VRVEIKGNERLLYPDKGETLDGIVIALHEAVMAASIGAIPGVPSGIYRINSERRQGALVVSGFPEDLIDHVLEETKLRL
jgi:hypothetical protein